MPELEQGRINRQCENTEKRASELATLRARVAQLEEALGPDDKLNAGSVIVIDGYIPESRIETVHFLTIWLDLVLKSKCSPKTDRQWNRIKRELERHYRKVRVALRGGSSQWIKRHDFQVRRAALLEAAANARMNLSVDGQATLTEDELKQMAEEAPDA